VRWRGGVAKLCWFFASLQVFRLFQHFLVDSKRQCLSVMALINRSDHVYWELVPLQGTPQWRSYIKNACRDGLPVNLFVQVFQKCGSSSQVHEEAKDVLRGKAWTV
jgi:hypothetical protein